MNASIIILAAGWASYLFRLRLHRSCSPAASRCRHTSTSLGTRRPGGIAALAATGRRGSLRRLDLTRARRRRLRSPPPSSPSCARLVPSRDPGGIPAFWTATVLLPS